jgi:hypothetical protein
VDWDCYQHLVAMFVDLIEAFMVGMIWRSFDGMLCFDWEG